MQDEPDYDDPETEERWCMERREEVADYLQGQGLNHGEIGEWPAWHVPPYVSIWAIESVKEPGWVGWWAICGDLPTDYISAAGIGMHPRAALRAFCKQWQTVADAMRDKRKPADITIGRPEDWPTLEPLLSSRIGILQRWAADDSVWDYDESEFEER